MKQEKMLGFKLLTMWMAVGLSWGCLRYIDEAELSSGAGSAGGAEAPGECSAGAARCRGAAREVC